MRRGLRLAPACSCCCNAWSVQRSLAQSEAAAPALSLDDGDRQALCFTICLSLSSIIADDVLWSCLRKTTAYESQSALFPTVCSVCSRASMRRVVCSLLTLVVFVAICGELPDRSRGRLAGFDMMACDD